MMRWLLVLSILLNPTYFSFAGDHLVDPAPNAGVVTGGPLPNGKTWVNLDFEFLVPSVSGNSASGNGIDVKGGGGSGSGNGWGTGTALGADLQGMNRLRQKEKDREQAEKYKYFIDKIGHTMSNFMSSLPKTEGELQGESYAYHPNHEVLQSDKGEARELSKDKGSLVLPPFFGTGDLQDIFNKWGMEVSSGDRDHAWIFIGVIDRYTSLERGYYQSLMAYGTSSTREKVAKAQSDLDKLAARVKGISSAPIVDIKLPSAKPIPYGSGMDKTGALIQIQLGLAEYKPITDPELYLKELAQYSVRQAFISIDLMDELSAKWFQHVAEQILNFLIGWDPATGLIRSLYESATGRNLVTDEKLSAFERSIASIGVITLGLAADLNKGLGYVEKLGLPTGLAKRLVGRLTKYQQNAKDLLGSVVDVYQKTAGKLISRQKTKLFAEIERGMLKDVQEFDVIRVMDSDAMNLEHLSQKPEHLLPWWTYGVEVVTRKEERFVRVSVNGWEDMDHIVEPVVKGSRPPGAFLVREEIIKNKTPGQIRKILSVEHVPRFVTEVFVPEGTHILSGNTSAVWGGVGGVQQFKLGDRIDETLYKNTRQIGETFNGF